ALSDTDSDYLLRSWEVLDIASLVFGSSRLVERLERSVYQASQARAFISLKAMQGGRLIDFWCSPRRRLTTCNPLTRGAIHASPELVALGMSISGIPASEIARWLSYPNRDLHIDVEHFPQFLEAHTDWHL